MSWTSIAVESHDDSSCSLGAYQVCDGFRQPILIFTRETALYKEVMGFCMAADYGFAKILQVAGRVESGRGNPIEHPLSVSGVPPLRARLGMFVIPFPVPAISHAACGY